MTPDGTPRTRLAEVPDGNPLLSVAQVASILDVTPRHVRNLIKYGELAVFNASVPGARRPTYRIRRESLAEFLRQPGRNGIENIEMRVIVEDFREPEES